ncbi:hypothetical protein N9N67_11965, partial [Bacteriovoracaceae bacterium]|nr:hypothetical protein [Bacteriovoracaceae bacterium]
IPVLSLFMVKYSLTFSFIILILHNFIAFIFWKKSANNPAESQVVTNSFLICLAGCLSLFSPIDFLNLNVVNELFGSAQFSYKSNLFLVFLLTQSIHYFIWLIGIPGFQNQPKVPVTIRKTYDDIQKKVGKKEFYFFTLLSIIFVLFSMYFGFEHGRQFYIMIASYHAFIEIASLTSLWK